MGKNPHRSDRLEIERTGHFQQHRPIGSLIVAGPVENQKHIIPGPVDVIEAEVQIVNILRTVKLQGGRGQPHVAEVIPKNTVDEMSGELSLGKRDIVEVILDPDAHFIADNEVGIKACGKAVSPPELLPPNA
jgi:hypothetical protein